MVVLALRHAEPDTERLGDGLPESVIEREEEGVTEGECVTLLEPEAVAQPEEEREAEEQPELEAELPDLIFEQVPQRLDELELEVIWQAADVVVELDRRRGAVGRCTAFDDVGIERALG